MTVGATVVGTTTLAVQQACAADGTGDTLIATDMNNQANKVVSNMHVLIGGTI